MVAHPSFCETRRAIRGKSVLDHPMAYNFRRCSRQSGVPRTQRHHLPTKGMENGGRVHQKKKEERESKNKRKKDEKDVVVSTDIHFGTTYKVLVTQLVFTNQLAGVGLARP